MRRIHNSTGSGAVDITIASITPAYRLLEVRLHLAAATTDLDDLTVSVDSGLGAAYDSVLAAPDPTEDLTTVASWRYADPVPPIIFPDDTVKIAWPNTGAVTWAIEVIGC